MFRSVDHQIPHGDDGLELPWERVASRAHAAHDHTNGPQRLHPSPAPHSVARERRRRRAKGFQFGVGSDITFSITSNMSELRRPSRPHELASYTTDAKTHSHSGCDGQMCESLVCAAPSGEVGRGCRRSTVSTSLGPIRLCGCYPTRAATCPPSPCLPPPPGPAHCGPSRSVFGESITPCPLAAGGEYESVEPGGAWTYKNLIENRTTLGLTPCI